MSSGVQVDGPDVPGRDRVLTPDALTFLGDLQRQFGGVRLELLHRRRERQAALDAGETLDFLPATRHIREAEWTVAPAPADFDDRRVEITGPAEPKMMINALNSGARVFMADLEDALSPTWANVIGGQSALTDAVRGTLAFTSPEGKAYAVGERPAQLVVRPRGWHLIESHVLVDGVPISASLFDAGLYLFHNAAERVARGSGPYLYLAKLESHQEAHLWNEVFIWAQARLGVPRGSVRATVLIETITAAFEMDEILYELREHAAGLNAGRWDYLFSAIKKLHGGPYVQQRHGHPQAGFAWPDRSQLTMTLPFMRAYTDLLVQTCHRRGAHAIGGMAAFIPNRRDERVTKQALDKVREDKERESAAGFDGTWVAHPDLVPVAMRSFDAVLADRPNQKDVLRDDVRVTADALRDIEVRGVVTEAGIRANIRVALAYLDAWLRGTGAAAIDNLMEDAATAEISRSQLWLWLHGGLPDLEYEPDQVTDPEGRSFDADTYARLRDEELERLGGAGTGRLAEARDLLDRLVLDDEFAEFLTLRAYALLD